MVWVVRFWQRAMAEDQARHSLLQGRSETVLSQLAHVLFVADSQVLAGVKNLESHRWVIRGYFRGEEWNSRWLEDPIRSRAGLPVLGFLELCEKEVSKGW